MMLSTHRSILRASPSKLNWNAGSDRGGWVGKGDAWGLSNGRDGEERTSEEGVGEIHCSVC